MNKRSLVVAAVVCFIVPHIALAAWWNPFSWFSAWFGGGAKIEKSSPSPIAPDGATHQVDARGEQKPKDAEKTFTQDSLCNTPLRPSSTIYPLRDEATEKAALSYIESRLGTLYATKCVERFPAEDDLRYGRVAFVDRRLTRLMEPKELRPITYYVDLNDKNIVSTTWMEKTGLLPLCGEKPELCTAKVSKQHALDRAEDLKFPTSTITIHQYKNKNEWRFGWWFLDSLNRKNLYIDLVTSEELITKY